MQYSKLFALAAVLATSAFAAPMPQADAAAATPVAATPAASPAAAGGAAAPAADAAASPAGAAVSPAGAAVPPAGAAVSPAGAAAAPAGAAGAPAGEAGAPAAGEMVLTLTVTVPAAAASATAAAASAAVDAAASAAVDPAAAGAAAPGGAVVGAAPAAGQAVLSAPAAGGSSAAAPAADATAAGAATPAAGGATPAAGSSAATPAADAAASPAADAAASPAADAAASPAADSAASPAADAASSPAADAAASPAASDAAAPAAGAASTSKYTNKTPFKAPHFVTYYDAVGFLPTPDQDIGSTNRIALAFYRSKEGGPFDNVKAWLDKADNLDMKKQWNDKGVAVMMSLFGAEDEVLGKDPKAFAKEVADVANESFDGVDVDFEDEGFKQDMAAATTWLVDFHKELKSLLKEDKLISAAPLATWFSTNEAWGYKSWYTGVAKEIADIVDWVAPQYYNAEEYYTDCSFITGKDQGKLETKGEGFTQLTEIFKPEQIVIGKPAVAANAPLGGFMEAADLNKCLAGTGGLMLWQQTDATAATFMDTAIDGVKFVVGE